MITNLILSGDTKITLYNLDHSNQKLVLLSSKDIFGDRINAEIKDGNTVKLALGKLKYSDMGSFELQVMLARGSESSIRKTAVTKLIVIGMERATICYSWF